MQCCYDLSRIPAYTTYVRLDSTRKARERASLVFFFSCVCVVSVVTGLSSTDEQTEKRGGRWWAINCRRGRWAGGRPSDQGAPNWPKEERMGETNQPACSAVSRANDPLRRPPSMDGWIAYPTVEGGNPLNALKGGWRVVVWRRLNGDPSVRPSSTHHPSLYSTMSTYQRAGAALCAWVECDAVQCSCACRAGTRSKRKQ